MTRLRLGIVLVLALLVLAAGWSWRHRGAAPPAAVTAAAGPPLVVSDTVLHPVPWQQQEQAYGEVHAVQGAALSAQVSGIVDQISFQSGQEVKAGTVLMRLRLYDDTARLQQLQASVSLWQANMARDQKQFQVQAISQATLDLDQSNLRQFQAAVAAQQQTIDQKVVRAPFDGRLGIRQVDLGEFLPAGTAIVTLEALDPIYVDFNVVQQRLGQLVVGQAVSVSVDAYPGRVFHATVLALDSHVDTQNRMVPVRASLSNPDQALLPGMFAVAQLALGQRRQVIAVPQAAVSFNPYGNFVYVLTPEPGRAGVMEAHSRVVTLGDTAGDLVQVAAGLSAGETVVTAGGFKLRDGALVTIDNSVRVADQLAPAPIDE